LEVLSKHPESHQPSDSVRARSEAEPEMAPCARARRHSHRGQDVERGWDLAGRGKPRPKGHRYGRSRSSRDGRAVSALYARDPRIGVVLGSRSALPHRTRIAAGIRARRGLPPADRGRATMPGHLRWRSKPYRRRPPPRKPREWPATFSVPPPPAAALPWPPPLIKRIGEMQRPDRRLMRDGRPPLGPPILCAESVRKIKHRGSLILHTIRPATLDRIDMHEGTRLHGPAAAACENRFETTPVSLLASMTETKGPAALLAAEPRQRPLREPKGPSLPSAVTGTISMASRRNLPFPPSTDGVARWREITRQSRGFGVPRWPGRATGAITLASVPPEVNTTLRGLGLPPAPRRFPRASSIRATRPPGPSAVNRGTDLPPRRPIASATAARALLAPAAPVAFPIEIMSVAPWCSDRRPRDHSNFRIRIRGPQHPLKILASWTRCRARKTPAAKGLANGHDAPRAIVIVASGPPQDYLRIVTAPSAKNWNISRYLGTSAGFRQAGFGR